MNKSADTYYEARCGDCGQTVTVVDEPSRHRNDDPHWAERYTAADPNFQLCWNCGRVLWSPILGAS